MFKIFTKKRIKNSTSERSNTGYKGITFRAKQNKYQATVVVNLKPKQGNSLQKTVWTKKCDSLEEAIAERENYINTLF